MNAGKHGNDIDAEIMESGKEVKKNRIVKLTERLLVKLCKVASHNRFARNSSLKWFSGRGSNRERIGFKSK